MVDTLDMTGRKDPVETALAGGRSLWDDAKRRLMNNKAAVISMWVLGVLILLAAFGPMVWVHDYSRISGNVELAPTLENWHWLGTDEQGRDLVARNLLGLRISMAVGLVATIVSLVIGVTWGAIAGFVGGRTDNLMMRFVDVLYAMPFIFFVILLLTVFGRNIILIFAAIGAVEWLTMSRIVRGQTLAIKGKEFIEAARAAGVPGSAIIRRHILPNVVGPVAVYVTLTIPVVIMGLAMLAFLSRINLSGTTISVIIAHGVMCSPFAMAIIRLRLSQMDPDLEAASWNMGGNQWQTLRHVIIPFTKPAIFAALFITMAVSFDEFAVAWFVSGLNETLPVKILGFLQGQVSPRINAIGSLAFLSSMTLIILAQLLLRSPQDQKQ